MSRKVFNIQVNKQRRAALRNQMTEPEKRLWYRVRSKQLGVKFRRQHGIGRYIADFYCPELNLVIEVDGDSHFKDIYSSYDAERDAYMKVLGIEVLRFTNSQVMQELDAVVEVILGYIRR